MRRWYFASVALASACTGGTAPTGLLTVFIETRAGAPLARQRVVFQAEDGHIFGSDETDGDGRVEGPMGPRGMVTWYTGIVDGKHQLITELNVSPNDELRFVADRGLPVDHRLQVQLPAAPEDATSIRLWTGCAQARVDAPIRKAKLNMTAACRGPGTTVLGYAYDGLGVPVAYALARHPRVDTEDLMMRPWAPFPESTEVTLSHPPHDALVSIAWMSLSLDGGVFGRQARGLPTGPQPATAFGRPPDFGDDMLVGLEIQFDRGSARIQRVTSATATQVTVNALDELLPRINGVGVDETTGPTVSWSPAPGLAEAADVVDVELVWPRGHWYFIAPAGTSVMIPDLPGEFDADPEPPMSAAVGYTDYLYFDDHREIRTTTSTAVRSWRGTYALSPRTSPN